MMKLKDYMMVTEASAVLGISSSTLRNWEKQGKIRVYRNPLNGYRLYQKQEVEEILAKIERLISITNIVPLTNFGDDSLQKEKDDL